MIGDTTVVDGKYSYTGYTTRIRNCIPDTKTVELDRSNIDEAVAIKAATKDPNLGIITHATKTPDNDGEESKEVMDNATRALNPTVVCVTNHFPRKAT